MIKKKRDYNAMLINIQRELGNYLVENKLKSLVLGISGGIDSALVAAIAKPICDKLGIKLHGRSITIVSNKQDEIDRSNAVGEAFCSTYEYIDLSKEYESMKNVDSMEGPSENDLAFKIRMGNIKARMRMIYLYNLAAKTGGLVLGTENKTEYNLAFFTLHGDAGTDLEPIEGLWKTEVYDMTEWIANSDLSNEKESKALKSCINCNATDGLGISNTDLDQILPDWQERHNDTRSGYVEVDEIFIKYFEFVEKLKNTSNKKNEIDLEIIKKSPVIQRYIRTDFKRNHPYVIKIK
jgi:NAD+ synthase